MWNVAARYGLLAAALLLALVVSDYALFFRPSATSVILGVAASVILAAGFSLGRMYLRRSRPNFDEAALARRLDDLGITEREFEVLELVAAGLSNQEIADRLFIAETTVKTHVSNIFSKLGARRRTDAVSLAQNAGILP